ncbi:restriction endonuclease subunit S [Clostridium perfringens]|uniref:restriction endonuclease subunit S n=1 Tax=Clostridium perfringens TaxID=1502 RepID=UPI002FE1330E
MNFIKVKELFEIKKGKKVEQIEAFKEGCIRYIQIDDLRNNNNIKFCNEEKSYIISNSDDIIIAWDGANAGTIGYGLVGAIGSTLAILRKKDNNFNTEYCGLFLKSKFNYLRDKCTGATIPHISRSSLEELEVPNIGIEKQKKIANILNLTQELIDKRKEQIEELDLLIKSKFIEMFGNPVSNPKGWEKVALIDLGELARGKSKHRPRNAPELMNGPYPLIQTGDVANAGIYIKEYTQTYSELGLQQSKMWKAGTLCITIAANIAKTTILTFDACFPDSIVAFIPNEKTNTMFIQFWMSFLQKILEDSAPESAQKNINLKILGEQRVIVPPIEFQNQFADFVKQVDKLKAEMEKSLKELKNNFNSLIQKAFKGELV